MKCFDCGHEIASGLKFCGNCGRDVRPKRRASESSDASRDTQPALHPSRSTWPNAESLAFVSSIFDQQRQEAREKRPARLNVIAILAFVVFFGVKYYLGIRGLAMDSLTTGLFVFGFFGIIALIPIYYNPCKMTEALYRTVPNATDVRGKIRCIHCGHVGVYRHGQYKSNQVFGDCSSCGTNLF